MHFPRKVSRLFILRAPAGFMWDCCVIFKPKTSLRFPKKGIGPEGSCASQNNSDIWAVAFRVNIKNKNVQQSIYAYRSAWRHWLFVMSTFIKLQSFPQIGIGTVEWGLWRAKIRAIIKLKLKKINLWMRLQLLKYSFQQQRSPCTFLTYCICMWNRTLKLKKPLLIDPSSFLALL